MDNTLIKRWNSDVIWRRKWEYITNWIFSTDKIMNIGDQTDYTSDGYFDMRGFPFNYDIDFKLYTELNPNDLKQGSRGLISNKIFRKVDFSLADFSGRYIENCEFYDCIFNNTVMCDINEAENLFVDCVFKKGIYGGALGLGESHYRNVQFHQVKMNRTSIWWPNFENCLFDRCNLKGTEFGGSHFKNVKFIGKVDGVWFKGKEESPNPGRYWESKYERWNQIIPMEADFSEATLSNITISDFCDLSKVILPKDGSCYLILNVEKMRNSLNNMVKERKTKLLEILLKFHVREKEGEGMGILCLNDVHRHIQKYIAPEEQQESYTSLKEICKVLYEQGILSSGK